MSGTWRRIARCIEAAEIRLLREGFHLAEIALHLIAYLNVAVACFRARGRYAQSEERVACLHEVESVEQAARELGLACYEMVGGCHHD